jgi:hypothetical protein
MAATFAIKMLWGITLLLSLCRSFAVDLSQPWLEPNINKNKVYCDLKQDVIDNAIIGYAIVKDGERRTS